MNRLDPTDSPSPPALPPAPIRAESPVEPNDSMVYGDGPGELFDPNAIPEPKKPSWVWLLVGVAALYCVYTAGALVNEKSKKPVATVPIVSSKPTPTPPKVFVTGRVWKPGVYTLAPNARVQDALKSAGGPRPDANVNALNLADWVVDGSKIEVPSRIQPTPIPEPTAAREIAEIAETPIITMPSAPPEIVLQRPRIEKPTETNKTSKPAGSFPRALTSAGTQSDNASPEFLRKHPIDLNKATAEQLEALPGIGPKIASVIVAYRKEISGFKNVEQLDEVKGIGPKKMEKIRPLVVVK